MLGLKAEKCLRGAILVVLALILSLAPTPALALVDEATEFFNAQNDVLFYDPTACSPGGDPDISDGSDLLLVGDQVAGGALEQIQSKFEQLADEQIYIQNNRRWDASVELLEGLTDEQWKEIVLFLPRTNRPGQLTQERIDQMLDVIGMDVDAILEKAMEEITAALQR